MLKAPALVERFDSTERGVKAELTPESDTRPISYWVGESAAVYLKKFATVVPKSSPTMHSSEQHLWFSFLKLACPFKGNNPISNLERWLTEVAHFPERVSQKLTFNAEEHNSYKLFDDQG